MPPSYQGYLDELSIFHATGWVRDLHAPDARIEVEIVLPGAQGETILGRTIAKTFSPILQQVGVGDGSYAFNLRFSQPVREAERAKIFARPLGASFKLENAPELKTAFPIIRRIALETAGITPETIAALLSLAPYAAPGGLRLTGLNLQTLEFLAQIPESLLPNFSVSANLAERVPPIVFERIAKLPLKYITISITSFDPEIFAALHPAPYFPFFAEQYAALNDAINRASAFYLVPERHYEIALNLLNLPEIPSLVARLLSEGKAAQIQIIPSPEITPKQCAWVQTALTAYPKAKLRARNTQPGFLLDPAGMLSTANHNILCNITATPSPIDIIAPFLDLDTVVLG